MNSQELWWAWLIWMSFTVLSIRIVLYWHVKQWLAKDIITERLCLAQRQVFKASYWDISTESHKNIAYNLRTMRIYWAGYNAWFFLEEFNEFAIKPVKYMIVLWSNWYCPVHTDLVHYNNPMNLTDHWKIGYDSNYGH